jgi:hypothetical protein
MAGMIIRNRAGQVILDMTMRISQNMGWVDTNGVNGSASLPAPVAGKQLYYVVVPLVDLQREKGKKPGVTLSGTSLTWSYSYSTNGWGYFSANCRIFYGAY